MHWNTIKIIKQGLKSSNDSFTITKHKAELAWYLLSDNLIKTLQVTVYRIDDINAETIKRHKKDIQWCLFYGVL